MTVLDIVIPVFDEAEGIPALLGRIESLGKVLTDAATHVIFVDDHSQES